MDEQAERMQILERIENGEISVEEGLHLIESLGSGGDAVAEPGVPAEDFISEIDSRENEAGKERIPGQADITDPLQPAFRAENHTNNDPVDISSGGIPVEAEKWRRYWVIPLWVGIGFTALGGILLSLAMQSSSWLGVWLVCATVPLTLGLLLIVLAGHSRVSPWLHLRVQQKSGASPRRIAFSFPLPVRPAVWFVRTFGKYIPSIRDIALDEALLSIDKVTNAQNPIYIQVDDDEEGEKVEIYIG